MKPLRTVQTVLVSHCLFLSLCLFGSFSILGLLSLIVSVAGLVLTFIDPEQLLFPFLLILGLVLGIVYYVSKPLLDSRMMNIGSIVPALLLVISSIHAVTIRYARYKSLYGVKSKDTFEDPEVWAKTHHFASLCYGAIIVPLFLLVFYLEIWAKILLSPILVIIASLTPMIYAHYLVKNIDENKSYQDY